MNLNSSCFIAVFVCVQLAACIPSNYIEKRDKGPCENRRWHGCSGSSETKYVAKGNIDELLRGVLGNLVSKLRPPSGKRSFADSHGENLITEQEHEHLLNSKDNMINQDEEESKLNSENKEKQKLYKYLIILRNLVQKEMADNLRRNGHIR